MKRLMRLRWRPISVLSTPEALTAADARALIPQLPELYSEPFADSSQLPTHLVCREPAAVTHRGSLG